MLSDWTGSLPEGESSPQTVSVALRKGIRRDKSCSSGTCSSLPCPALEEEVFTSLSAVTTAQALLLGFILFLLFLKLNS